MVIYSLDDSVLNIQILLNSARDYLLDNIFLIIHILLNGDSFAVYCCSQYMRTLIIGICLVA